MIALMTHPRAAAMVAVAGPAVEASWALALVSMGLVDA